MIPFSAYAKRPFSALSGGKKRASRIIMVASGKGGVGKTWFSISLAHALAENGEKVLLVDGDMGLANVDIQLGLMPKKDLSLVLKGCATVEEVILSYTSANFDIIAGRSGCGRLSFLSPERLMYIQTTIKRIAPRYNTVVIDMGTGIGETVWAFGRIADEGLIMITDEPTSLTDAYALIKLAHANTELAHLKLKIVANKMDTLEAGEKAYGILKKTCETFLNFTPGFLGTIRCDKAVRKAICHQSPLLSRYAQSPAAHDVRQMITRL